MGPVIAVSAVGSLLIVRDRLIGNFVAEAPQFPPPNGSQLATQMNQAAWREREEVTDSGSRPRSGATIVLRHARSPAIALGWRSP